MPFVIIKAASIPIVISSYLADFKLRPGLHFVPLSVSTYREISTQNFEPRLMSADVRMLEVGGFPVRTQDPLILAGGRANVLPLNCSGVIARYSCCSLNRVFKKVRVDSGIRTCNLLWWEADTLITGL